MLCVLLLLLFQPIQSTTKNVKKILDSYFASKKKKKKKRTKRNFGPFIVFHSILHGVSAFECLLWLNVQCWLVGNSSSSSLKKWNFCYCYCCSDCILLHLHRHYQPKHISFDIRTFVVVLQIFTQLSIVESVVIIFVLCTNYECFGRCCYWCCCWFLQNIHSYLREL